MDAAGSERAALFGVSEGGPMSTLFAATYPERTWALLLFASYPRELWAPDYPYGVTETEWWRDLDEIETHAGDPHSFIKLAAELAPSADEWNQQKLAELMRQAGTPGARVDLMRMNREIDVRPILPAIRVPTLVMNREGDHPSNVGGSRYLAEHIPGARHIELNGVDHAPSSGDAEPVLNELQMFLEDAWRQRNELEEHDSVLATILFTDIVGSTELAARIGDSAWRTLLQQHHAIVRRELARYQGRELDTAGDGFFAAFDGPARAVEAASAISEVLRELDLEIRAGLHTGECEVADGKIAGIAVSIGARISALAAPGEVLVSSTVKDLVAGSGIVFADRGEHELKGVGTWRLHSVENAPG
jgi:class 3 adenylate cyclase